MKHIPHIALLTAALLTVSAFAAAGCSLLPQARQPQATAVPAPEPTQAPAVRTEEELAIEEAGERLAGLQAELARVREETERAQSAAQTDAGRSAPIVVACAGCTINGGTSYRLNTPGESVTVRADVPLDLMLDHWEINGSPLDSTESELTLTPESSCFIEAFTCRRRILTAVHATFRLLDEKGKAGGKSFSEFDFQEDYFNPASEKYHEGGTISAVITASVPANHEIAYWLIDGVVYRFNRVVTSITVTDLDRAAVYEPVFKSTGAPDPGVPGPTPYFPPGQQRPPTVTWGDGT